MTTQRKIRRPDDGRQLVFAFREPAYLPVPDTARRRRRRKREEHDRALASLAAYWRGR